MREEEFARLFARVCCESCSNAACRQAKKEPAYQEAAKQYKELFAAILEKLGKEERKLLFRMEEARSEKIVLQESRIYRQAFQDRFSLLQ